MLRIPVHGWGRVGSIGGPRSTKVVALFSRRNVWHQPLALVRTLYSCIREARGRCRQHLTDEIPNRGYGLIRSDRSSDLTLPHIWLSRLRFEFPDRHPSPLPLPPSSYNRTECFIPVLKTMFLIGQDSSYISTFMSRSQNFETIRVNNETNLTKAYMSTVLLSTAMHWILRM